jgi:hypothetical protein
LSTCLGGSYNHEASLGNAFVGNCKSASFGHTVQACQVILSTACGFSLRYTGTLFSPSLPSAYSMCNSETPHNPNHNPTGSWATSDCMPSSSHNNRSGQHEKFITKIHADLKETGTLDPTHIKGAKSRKFCAWRVPGNRYAAVTNHTRPRVTDVLPSHSIC